MKQEKNDFTGLVFIEFIPKKIKLYINQPTDYSAMSFHFYISGKLVYKNNETKMCPYITCIVNTHEVPRITKFSIGIENYSPQIRSDLDNLSHNLEFQKIVSKAIKNRIQFLEEDRPVIKKGKVK